MATEQEGHTPGTWVADMAEFMAAADRDHENIKRILIENGVKPYPAEMMTMEIRALEIPAALSPPALEERRG